MRSRSSIQMARLMELTLGDIAAILEVAPPSLPEQRVAGYSIDSRTIRKDELFFAVRGERLDGHDFVAVALEAGAGAAVVAAERQSGLPAPAQPNLEINLPGPSNPQQPQSY